VYVDSQQLVRDCCTSVIPIAVAWHGVSFPSAIQPELGNNTAMLFKISWLRAVHTGSSFSFAFFYLPIFELVVERTIVVVQEVKQSLEACKIVRC
jgi:hypothetical protein